MKLFKLEPVKRWKPWYNCNFTIIMRAKNELRARLLAEDCGGAETCEYDADDTRGPGCWLNPLLTSCVELKVTGDEEVICVDCAEA